MSNADQVVAAARQYLGTPYRHQSASLGAGCDCLGLLRGVWRALYGKEPPVLPPYRADLRDLKNADALSRAAHELLLVHHGALGAGQVVLFRLNLAAYPKHCAVMVSPTRFIHAQEHLGVVEANLTPGWAKRLAGQFNFPPSI